jgi:hypothetical protein
MLDYYGSIAKTPEEVDSELISYFKEYDKYYIQSIIYNLRNENIIQNTYSVSGWMVFCRKEVIQSVKTKIKKDTEKNKKKLLLVRYFIENDFPLDIMRDR